MNKCSQNVEQRIGAKMRGKGMSGVELAALYQVRHMPDDCLNVEFYVGPLDSNFPNGLVVVIGQGSFRRKGRSVHREAMP